MTVRSNQPEVQPARLDARERILEATSALLAERDTLDVPISEISARSELNHGLVRYYFGGKEGLLLALLERSAGRALDDLSALVEKDIPPLKKIEQHIRGIINTYFRYPYINRLINMLQSSSPKNAQELSRIFIEPLIDFQAQLLRQAAEHDDIQPVDPLAFYYSVTGACEALFHSRKTLPYAFGVTSITPEIKNRYADFVVRMTLGALLRDADEGSPRRHHDASGKGP